MKSDKHHILYVDDEENNLTSFKATFRQHYNIHTAPSAREGMKILRDHPIQVIVTDQRMPEMTGVQFFEAIIPEYPDAIRMVLTGFSDVEAIIKAINTGRVYRYITKPWDENELKMTIDGAISYFELQSRNRQLVEEMQQQVSEQERIMKLFSRYVPPDVVADAVKQRGDRPSLDGESRIVSVLFSDIRGFTRLSSRLDPKQVVSLLNDYLSVMNAAVKRHKGSINKLLGDGIVAVFGAPMSYMENQSNAIFCAVEMIERLDEFNAVQSEKIGADIAIGIGIATGEVIVGNIGSDERIEYAAIGDAVGRAVRVEELTKTKPNSIMIDARTKRIVDDEFQLRLVDGTEDVYEIVR